MVPLCQPIQVRRRAYTKILYLMIVNSKQFCSSGSSILGDSDYRRGALVFLSLRAYMNKELNLNHALFYCYCCRCQIREQKKA